MSRKQTKLFKTYENILKNYCNLKVGKLRLPHPSFDASQIFFAFSHERCQLEGPKHGDFVVASIGVGFSPARMLLLCVALSNDTYD